MNKVEVFIGDFSYVIDEEDKIIILKKDSDILGNKFFVQIRQHYPPAIREKLQPPSNLSYYPSNNSQPHDEYNSMKEMIMSYANLKHHAKLQDILNT